MIKKFLLLTYSLFSLFWLQAQSPGGVSSNLVGWYSADVSASATTWTDRSPAGNNLTGAGTPTFTNTLNGNVVATFNGTSQRYSIAATSASWPGTNTANTYYYVAVPTGTGTSRSVFGKGTAANAANGMHSGKGTTATTLVSGATGAGTVNKTSVWTQGVARIIRTGFNGGTTGAHYLSDNGTSETAAGSSNPNYAATSTFAIGSQNTATGFWDGNIAEVIAYSGKHSAADFNRIETYLAVKYGITKAGNYLNSASANIWTSGAGYDNNIAGIGRDDMGGASNTGLNQKQSQSINSGIQPLIGNVNIASANAANTNNFTANQSALMWGSDTGSTSFATSFVFGEVNNRMARIWRVQETGTVGTVKVAFRAADLAVNATSPALLVSSDVVFDGTDTRTAMTLETIGGVQYYTATVDFTTGQFFTFAALVTAPGGVFGEDLWLKADAGTSTTIDNTAITQWDDQSGNANHVSQATSGLRPLYRNNSSSLLNFNPIVSFDGVNDYMDATTFAINGSSNTLFSAVKPNGFNLTRNVLGYGLVASDVGGDLRFNSGILEYGQINTTTYNSVIGTTAVTLGTPLLFGSSMNNVPNGASIYQNNRTVNTNTINQIPSAGNLVSIASRTNIGRGDNLNGFIPEVVTYNFLLTALERQRVNSYLAIKYGITMDQTTATNYLASNGTTIFWNTATNTGYHNDIAGIARDDVSALNQKQSSSVNTGLQPVIGNGNIFDTNANNTNNFSADLSAMVWGADTGSTSFATSFLFGGLNYRMGRIWKVQETGTVGTVKVALPASQIAGMITQLNLVTSSDAVFDGTDTRTAMTLETLGGVQYYTATVDFSTGQFFTFAALITAPGGVIGTTSWFKADAGVTLNGSNVSALANQSANANLTQLAQPTASRQPAFTANSWNFNPGITYDGTSDILENTFPSMLNVLNATNNEVFGALSVTGGTTSRVYFQVSDNGSIANRLSLENTITHFPTTSNSISNTGLSQTSNLPSIINFVSGSGNMSYAINGNAAVTSSFSGSVTAGATPRYMLGAYNQAGTYSHFISGNINEVVTYDRTLSTTERQRVQSYLGLKYGQTMAHNYIAADGTTVSWNTTTNTGYNNNIAGIGRDDLTALYQKQSQSVNTGFQVVMALGTAAATNQANANTIAADRQFFIWGDDNGSLSNQILTGNLTYPKRFARIWKTQNTGAFAQDITVYYPVSAFDNSPASTVSLLYGGTIAVLNNGTASVIAQSGTTSINSINHYIFTIPAAEIANMQFFTFTGTQTSPGGVNGESIWLRADVGTSTTTNGTGIQTWGDQSGSGNDASQITTVDRPQYRSNSTDNVNFNPVINFDGSGDFFNLPSGFANFTAGLSLFSVHNFTNTGSYARIIDLSNGASNDNIVFAREGINTSYAFGTYLGATMFLLPTSNNSVFTNRFGLTNWNQAGGTAAATVSGSVSLNGLNNTTGSLRVPNNTTRSQNYIGRSPFGTDSFFAGYHPELILYPRSLTASEQQRVNTYLAIKYGLTLGTTASPVSYLASDDLTTIWTADATYQNNMAGIARDDNSALNQKQSVSINSGIQPVIGNGNIFDTNANNTNNFSLDLSALVWGSNTGSTSFATSFAFGGLNNRMARIWRVQETGTVGTVKVALPASQIAGSISQLTFVVSADATFDGTDTRTAMTLETLGGVQYYTATVDFASGQFFTFAAYVTAPGGVITGLRQWLKADAGTSTTTSGAGVATWSDQSGNGFDALQSSAALAPLYRTAAFANKYNFNPYLDYSGGKGSYNAGTSAAIFTSDNNNASIFVMSQGYTTGGSGVGSPWAVGFNTSGTTYLDQGKFSFPNSSTAMAWVRASGSNLVTSSGIDDQNTANQIYVVDWNGATATTKSIRARQNGRILNSAANTNPLTIGTNTTNQFGISDGGNGSIVGDNNMGTFFTSEMIAYNTQLTELEMTRVSSYLAIKYGKTLSRDNSGNGTAGETITGSILEGDYVASDGITRIWNSDAVYQNNIAGIARDDASGLNQKQSQSVNSGIQPVIGNGNIFDTNANNTNGFTANLSALVWGSDTGSTSFATSFVFGGVNNRMARIWKVQETGTVGTVKVALPVSQLALSPNTTALALLVSGDAVFDGTDTRTAMTLETLGGIQYYTATVDFTSGLFFTFAAYVTAPGGVLGSSLWLKANNGISSSGILLNTWASSSSNNIYTTSGTKPTVLESDMNFNPVVNFPGNHGSVTTINSNFSDWTVYFILKGQDNGSSSNLIDNSNFGLTYETWNNTNKLGAVVYTSGSLPNPADYASTVDKPDNQVTLLKFQHSSTSNNIIISSITNGVLTTVNLNTNNTNRPIGIQNLASLFKGAFPEMILHPTSTLTMLEENRIYSYMSLKYGATYVSNYLASDGGTILWNTTTNTGYNNNIAGIARDDVSALYQKQSQSVNTGSQVVISLGTVAATNQANANTIAADRQFFLWGDDNGSLTTQVTTGNNTYTYRFTRVWKTQNTGTFAENMTVYYPVAAFGNASASTVALLYGASAASLSNGTASAIAQSGTTTINGISYYTFTVPSAQVANMQFFSFAGTQTSPGGVAGINLWLKADAGTSTTTNAATLSTWADQSGQRANLATTSSGLQTFKNNAADNINFNPAVYFDGLGGLNFGNDYIFTPAGNGGVTLFAANKPDNAVATKNNQVIFDFGEGTGNAYGLNYGNNNSNFYSPTALGGAVSSGVTNGIVASIIGAQINFNNNQYSFINGMQSGTTAITLPAITATQINESATHDPSAGPVSIGRQSKSTNFTSNGTRAYQGHLSEVVHYSANLTAIQRLRVNTYLALKYGTTLTRDNNGNATGGEVISGSVVEGDYVASDGTTRVWNSDAAYLNNIAGIGRDDLTALYQKQSQSVNSGSQVVMALGTAAASNQANANTIPTDKQFFIWGDDNGSINTFVSTGNVSYPSRFTRVWRAQNTGTFAQNMTVYYPVSAFGTSLASSVGLLYGSSAASLSNGSASVIPQSGTTTINGVSYYAFTVPSAQVANMQFFSFTGATVCYKPAVTVGTTLDAKHGITALNRAGTAGDNWPMVRKGAWTVLEAKTKGFVINRLTAAQIAAIPPANLVEGMMVYDTTSNCMKVYTSTDGGTTFGWQCITTQTCPD